ncbi:ROK family protein, partial [Candidatus Binatus sp.]|uniref:ROK family protein n=1 Tax=Candidatus Binatus sp. TaxID=2811406 RepID=UPI003C85BC1E
GRARVPAKVWIGVDIGGTKTAIVVSRRLPEVSERLQFATLPAKGPERALDLIGKGIDTLLKKRGLAKSAIRGIGVSCGGPLDRISGTIQAPPNLATWIDIPIKAILERQFGVRCNVENDANAGAVAEHRYGAGRGVGNMIFLTMGTGLGAGIIVDGRLYHGTDDLAGEIGHVRLTRGGPIGYHKRGSVEGWASGGGMAQVAMRAVADARKRGRSTTLRAHRGTLTARDVCAAAKHGDVVAMRIVRTTGERLGQVLAILVDVLNPQRIVIGGIAMRTGEMILGPAREVMMREALATSAASCEVVAAALGERIGDVAALCVAVGL